MAFPSSFLRRREQMLRSAVPIIAHAEYSFYVPIWQQLRDFRLGAKAVKENGELYLRKPSGLDRAEWAAYIDRTGFTNFVDSTVTPLVGTLCRHNPEVLGLNARTAPGLQSIGVDGAPIDHIVKSLTDEVIHMGRAGVLLDFDDEAPDRPFLKIYEAEHILNWRSSFHNGRETLDEVILREFEVLDKKLRTNLRRLFLDIDQETGRTVYKWQIFVDRPPADGDLNNPDFEGMPTRRGMPFATIPFDFFSPSGNAPRVQRTPIIDVSDLNREHFQVSSLLAHARFYTGSPIFFVTTGGQSDGGEYRIGPSTVWEIESGQRAGMIEYSNTGLTALENSLERIESRISLLGGRLQASGARTSEAAAQRAALREANEDAFLVNVAESVERGMTNLLRVWAWLLDTPERELADIELKMPRDFLISEASAREFRAISALYQDGVLPIEVVFTYMRNAGVIPSWIGESRFIELLNSQSSFPAQADVQARQAGFPDAAAQREAGGLLN